MRELIKPGIIAELLAEAGLAKPKQNSISFILECPRCLKKDKLYIRKKDGRFVCWVCKERDGFQGAPEYALTEIMQRPVREIQGILYGAEGITGSLALDIELTDFFDGTDEIPTIAQPLPEVLDSPDFRDIDSEWGLPGAKYLESRGIPMHIALEYGIRYWPARSRIVFPVKSKGKLLGWQCRIIRPDQYIDEDGDIVKIPKALTYEGLKKDRALMFADRIVGEHAILTEGPIDAIKAHKCGGNVSSLGKAVSQTQLNLLRFSGIKKLYLGLDPDASDEIGRILNVLGGDMELYDMRPPPDTDLGAMSFDDVYQLYKSAKQVTKANLFLYLKEWNVSRD